MARILIVEDQRDTADTFAALVKSWGHETRKAFDGAAVLQIALAFNPDVVLLDIGLPKVDGYTVASRLRQFKQLSGLKIVAVTGYASPADLQRCKEVGIDEHFAKPVDPELVRSYLARFGTAAKRTSQEVHHQDVP